MCFIAVRMCFLALFAALLCGCHPMVRPVDHNDWDQKTISFQSVSTADIHSVGQVQLVFDPRVHNNRMVVNTLPGCVHKLSVEQKGDFLSIHSGDSRCVVATAIDVYLDHIDSLTVRGVDTLRMYSQHGISAFSLNASGIGLLQWIGSFSLANVLLNQVQESTATGQMTIERLHCQGAGQLTIDNLLGNLVLIDLSGQTKTVLNGYFGVSHIIQTGSSSLFVQWLQGGQVAIDGAGNSTAQLSGNIDHFIVHQSQDTKLEAQYLRARTAEVKTINRAVVSVSAEKRLFAEAKQSSQIYYYGSPPFMYKDHDDGAVILHGR